MDVKMEKLYYIFVVIMVALFVGVAIAGAGLMVGAAIKDLATNTQSEEPTETTITIDGNLTTADVTPENRKVLYEYTSEEYSSMAVFYQGANYNNVKNIKLYNDGTLEAITAVEEAGDEITTTSVLLPANACRITLVKKTTA